MPISHREFFSIPNRLDMHSPCVYNPYAIFLGSSIWQSERLLTARFQVRVLAEEPLLSTAMEFSAKIHCDISKKINFYCLIVSKKGVSTIGDALRFIYNSDRQPSQSYSVFFSDTFLDSFFSVPSLFDSVFVSVLSSSFALPFFLAPPDGER